MLSTQEDEAAEQGKDWEDIQQQRLTELQRALKMVKEAGLPEHVAYSIAGFTTIDPMIIQNAMNQPPNSQM
jgi:hypothetical protein